MLSRNLLLVLGICFVLGSTSTYAIQVPICHVPDGNYSKAMTILVGPPAAVMHVLKHREDSLGHCEDNCIIHPDRCDDHNLCTHDICSSLTSLCFHLPVDCDSRNPCIQDSCDPALGCLHTPLTDQACNDDDYCTRRDLCTADGECRGEPIVECCRSDDQCDDHNACTIDTCNLVERECVHTPVPIEHVPCMIESCLPETGEITYTPIDCSHLSHDAECQASYCDLDTEQCTVGNINERLPCDVGNKCFLGKTCVDGQCGGFPTVVLCSGVNAPCHQINNPCNPAEGCIGGPLPEGSGCTAGDHCASTCDANGECRPVCGEFQDRCHGLSICSSYGGNTCYFPINNTCAWKSQTCNPESGQCEDIPCSTNSQCPLSVDPCLPNLCVDQVCRPTPKCGASGRCREGICDCTSDLQCGDINADRCNNYKCDGATGQCVLDGGKCGDQYCNPSTGVCGCTADEQCATDPALCFAKKCNVETGSCYNVDKCRGVIPGTNDCMYEYCASETATTCNLQVAICSTPPGSCLKSQCSASGACQYVPNPGASCNSPQPCMKGTCSSTGTCEYTPNPGVSCTPSQPCMKGTCSSAGSCVGTPDDTLSCSSGNTCADSHCSNGECIDVFKPSGTACPSGDPCKEAACINNTCTTVKVNCQSCTTTNLANCIPPNPCMFSPFCTNGRCSYITDGSGRTSDACCESLGKVLTLEGCVYPGPPPTRPPEGCCMQFDSQGNCILDSCSGASVCCKNGCFLEGGIINFCQAW